MKWYTVVKIREVFLFILVSSLFEQFYGINKVRDSAVNGGRLPKHQPLHQAMFVSDQREGAIRPAIVGSASYLVG